MPTIASQPTIRGMLLNALRTNSDLLAVLRPTNPADGAGAILSTANVGAGAVQQPAKPPFLLVRYEGGGPLGDDDLELGTWAIECHVAPTQRLFILDRLVDLIAVQFEHAVWETPTTQLARPIRSQRGGATGELADDGYTTIKRIARIRLYMR